MATVRIYKVAEVLNTSSQEVVALLKRDHGIEVKSASSTIEEVVARQFVERQARQRGITLPPPAQMFSDAVPVRPVAKKGTAAKPEPPKPTAPALPPPRLIRVVRPAHPFGEGQTEAGAQVYAPDGAAAVAPPPPTAPELEVEAPVAVAPEPEAPPAPAAPPLTAAPEPEVAVSAPAATAPAIVEEAAPAPPPAPEVVEEPAPPAAAEPVAPVAPAAAAPAAALPARPDAPVAPEPPAQEAPAPAAAAAPPAPPVQAPGRLVPPTLRLRIEDPSAPAVEGPRPGSRPAAASPAKPAAAPQAPAAAAAATTTPARPATTLGRATTPQRPGATNAPGAVRPPVGGPRPVPTQPQRPGTLPPSGIRSPLTQVVRPSYAPTGYALPGRTVPGGAPPGGPRPPAGARPQQPGGPRPPQRPSRPQPGGQRRGGDRPQGPMMSSGPAAPPPITKLITLAEGMTVKDLADKLEVKVKDVLKKLLDKRMMLTINSTLDSQTATMIAREFGAEVEMRSFEEEMVEAEAETYAAEDRVTRAPVVTVMGHVDHGKTSLLDAIRETRVAEREAGGITQHIGAYAVDVNGRKVVFLDTPGHEAFTMMRARGARVTDVVIVVVAADDGVMPQTREAIDHARAANVPIVVAINKIDKPEANAERVMKELSDLGLVPEKWGGQTVTVEVSAKKRLNLDLLLEMILLVTELSELKANPKKPATGTVLEAKLDKGRGPVATVLVQDGSLHVGDNFIAGTIVGKVRALIDDRGRNVRTAPPSTPVEVLGLAGLPQPGDTFQSIVDAAKARQIAMFRQNQAKEKLLGSRQSKLTLESLQQQLAEGQIKELSIVIKADVQGSAEVLADTLTKLSNDQAKIRIIHAGVGAINESDVLLASASSAIVIGFNVRPDRNATDLADRETVDIRLHSVIYNVTDEIKKAMAGLLEPTFKEVRLGIAEVRQIFKVPKAGTVAGCMVVEGMIKRSGDAQARLLRDNVVVYEGKLGSLRRFKDDVSEVKTGFECGISFERFNDLKVGDVIEAFTVQRVEAAVS